MNDSPERIDRFAANPFKDGPTEFLVKAVAKLISGVPQFKNIFSDNIDAYRRSDYSERSLPGLRVYNLSYTKTSEDWFIDGDLLIDVIWPASFRRGEQQQLPDTMSAALLQQFRRQEFFNQVRVLAPGLNELGRTFSVNKDLGFSWQDDANVVPLTQTTVNFRIDLRVWDQYLEATNRTKESPFEETLKNLETIAITVKALAQDDDEESNQDVSVQESIKPRDP